MVVKGEQLIVDVIRCPGENEAGIDGVRYRHRARIDVAAIARLNAASAEPRAARLQGLSALRLRCVTRGVHKLWCDNARGTAVAEDLIRSAPTLLVGLADADQRHIGELIESGGPAGLGGGLAIGLVDCRGA